MKTNEQTLRQTTSISNSPRAYHHVHNLPLTHTFHLRSQISTSKDHALPSWPNRQQNSTTTPIHASVTSPPRKCLTSRLMNERKHSIIHQPGHTNPTRSHTTSRLLTPRHHQPPPSNPTASENPRILPTDSTRVQEKPDGSCQRFASNHTVHTRDTISKIVTKDEARVCRRIVYIGTLSTR